MTLDGGALLDLPPELLVGICVLVGCPTVAWCRLVCRRLRDVVDASLELQYKIELARDGMVDAADTPAERHLPATTTAERLARLRALRRAWATLDWTRRVGVPMPGSCCAYELVGGLFCKTEPGGKSRTLSVTCLPGATREGGIAKSTRDVGLATRDFALDPGQDVVVYLRGGESVPMALVYPGVLELHVRTLSTDRAHPEAAKAVLNTSVLYPVTSVCVQIVEDVVGIMCGVDPELPRITVWNWKTGERVVDRTGRRLRPGAWDFSFVHSRALMVTTTGGSGALELFTFSCSPSPSPWDPDSDSDALVHVASLQLPETHPSVRVLSLSTHTGPFVAGCPPGAAFVAANQARLHVLAIEYAQLPSFEARTRPRVGMVVHQRVLERYLALGEAKAREEEGKALPVPWTEWSTDARMLPHLSLFQWLRYVHGERFAMVHAKAGQSTFQVLDFNDRRAPYGDEQDDPPVHDLGTARIDYPTRILMPHVFLDVVESGLPYREVRRQVRGDYSGIMIDDERIVGVKHSAFLTGDMKEIDVFTM